MGESPELSSDRLLSTLPVDDRGRPLIGGISLVRRIGAGGMGAVYLGEQTALKRQVAVKILPFTLVEQEPSIVARFLGEARMAASLESDHVVRVVDVGCEHQTHYFVMQYVHGESAGTLIKRRRAETGKGLPEEVVLRLGIAAARGLAAAHAAGIVHRDVRPDNILIPEGRYDYAKLADLGLAKPEGGQSTFGTLSHVAMGTPGFMAPEQAENAKKAGPAADVFALGATLYAMLQGFPPFRGTSLVAVMRAAAEEDPAPLPDGVSPGLRSVVQKCLGKKPADRYANGTALLAALERVKANPRAVEGGLRVARRPLPAPTPPPRRRSSMVPWSLGLGAVGVLAVAVVLMSGRRDPDPLPSPSPSREAASPSATPDPVADLLAKAARFEREDRLDDALAALSQAAVLAPDDPEIVRSKERISAKLAGRESAASREKNFREWKETLSALRLKAEGLDDPDAWKPAIEAAEKMERYASTTEQKTEAAACLRRAREGREDAVARREARGRSEAARAERKRDFDRKAGQARQEKAPAAAISLWREALGLADEPADKRVAREAIAELEAALAAAQRDRELAAMWKAAKDAYDAGKWEDAIRLGREFLDRRPEDPEARKLLEEAQVRLDKDPYVLNMRDGKDGLSKGDWTLAKQAFENALRYRPGDPEATASLAETLKRLTPAKVVVTGGRMEITLNDRIKFRLVRVRDGDYAIGEGATARTVTLMRPYWIATTEVTQAQWEALMDPAPCEFRGADHPVERVSWYEIQGWLYRLTDRLADYTAHLPTEAQWEVACRAGTRGPVYAGSGETAQKECAWFNETAGERTQPVGKKRANALGLYDMLGNVWEWCADSYEALDMRERVDPTGGPDPGRKSIRGGGWDSPIEYMAATRRDSYGAGERQRNAGFRFILLEGFHPRLRPERKTVFLDDAGKVAVEFVKIPRGAFLMGPNTGKPEDQHEVVLRSDFWMQTTEVTRAQWEAVMGPAKYAGAEPPLPAAGLSWTDAQEFVKRAGARIPFGKPSLPTEAEWEFACRAGTKSKWFWGNDPEPAKDFGVFYGGPGLERAAGRRPNPWGLFDMSGNAMEWCQDWFGELPRVQAVDPRGPATGRDRVARGGFYGWDPKDGMSGTRNAVNPASRDAQLGFRLAVH